MEKLKQRLFEIDRRMELKLRLAARRAALPEGDESIGDILILDLPERKLLRLIERVRRL